MAVASAGYNSFRGCSCCSSSLCFQVIIISTFFFWNLYKVVAPKGPRLGLIYPWAHVLITTLHGPFGHRGLEGPTFGAFQNKKKVLEYNTEVAKQHKSFRYSRYHYLKKDQNDHHHQFGLLILRAIYHFSVGRCGRSNTIYP